MREADGKGAGTGSGSGTVATSAAGESSLGGGGSCAGAAASTSCRLALASKTCVQLPQRTQPSEMRNWSGTILNIVPQMGQRVTRLMSAKL